MAPRVGDSGVVCRPIGTAQIQTPKFRVSIAMNDASQSTRCLRSRVHGSITPSQMKIHQSVSSCFVDTELPKNASEMWKKRLGLDGGSAYEVRGFPGALPVPGFLLLRGRKPQGTILPSQLTLSTLAYATKHATSFLTRFTISTNSPPACSGVVLRAVSVVTEPSCNWAFVCSYI